MRQKHLYPIAFILIFGAAGLFVVSEILSVVQTDAIGKTLTISLQH
jgi:hypothetical protein